MNIVSLLNIVAGMVPIVNALVETLAMIKSQTEKDHPEVWAKVRDDWKDSVQKWNDKIG